MSCQGQKAREDSWAHGLLLIKSLGVQDLSWASRTFPRAGMGIQHTQDLVGRLWEEKLFLLQNQQGNIIPNLLLSNILSHVVNHSLPNVFGRLLPVDLDDLTKPL